MYHGMVKLHELHKMRSLCLLTLPSVYDGDDDVVGKK